jgi:hypothetical protein
MGRTALLGLIDSLRGAVRGLTWEPGGTEWADYYENTNYTDEGARHKAEVVGEYLEKASPKTVWDLGANTGAYSAVAADRGAHTVAFDLDPSAVEKAYRSCSRAGRDNVVPLLMDLTNPSPSIGWANEERMSLGERGPADLVLALALIHHLAISNNVPLDRLARFFAGISTWLVIEFVPKSDSQVERLLATREDVFPGYTRQGFENAFAACFDTIDRRGVSGSERAVYLMKVRGE